ncbi:hypothetical protein OAW26_05035 [Luminiphilus sp.]|nr:hypothetical protein [Luminiphilus sp.]
MKLVTTSVVRGSQQGESHGGLYLIDLQTEQVDQVLDWNTGNIDWAGRGADRGLRGIAFDDERIYVAASDELFAYSKSFKLLGSWRNQYLKHCHEISIFGRTLFLTSTGFDCILGFNLDTAVFDWGMQIQENQYRFRAARFDPTSDDGPMMLNRMHINNVHCNAAGMYIGGRRTGGMLHYNGKTITMAVTLPTGTHNAQPFRDGVLFNDSEANVVRYTGRGEGDEDRAIEVPIYGDEEMTHLWANDGEVARPHFARGLCQVTDSVVAGGSSPSTVSIYDLRENKRVVEVAISRDVRNAIHGLEIWPH